MKTLSSFAMSFGARRGAGRAPYRKIVLGALLPALFGLAGEAAAALRVDSFVEGAILPGALAANAAGERISVHHSGSPLQILGGSRRLTLEKLEGAGAVVVSTRDDIGKSALLIANKADARSRVTLTWDGMDALDITQGGINDALVLKVSKAVDRGMNLRIEVSDGVRSSAFSQNLQAGFSGLLQAPFESFSGAVSFVAVDSIEMTVSSDEVGLDAAIEYVEARGTRGNTDMSELSLAGPGAVSATGGNGHVGTFGVRSGEERLARDFLAGGSSLPGAGARADRVETGNWPGGQGVSVGDDVQGIPAFAVSSDSGARTGNLNVPAGGWGVPAGADDWDDWQSPVGAGQPPVGGGLTAIPQSVPDTGIDSNEFTSLAVDDVASSVFEDTRTQQSAPETSSFLLPVMPQAAAFSATSAVALGETAPPSSVPAPGVVALLGAGLIGLSASIRRRSRSARCAEPARTGFPG